MFWFKETTFSEIHPIDFLVVIPEPGPRKDKRLQKPFRVYSENEQELIMYVKGQVMRAIDMFLDDLDFGLKPWHIEDPETGKKEVYIEDQNILRKMYKLKSLYGKKSSG